MGAKGVRPLLAGKFACTGDVAVLVHGDVRRSKLGNPAWRSLARCRELGAAWMDSEARRLSSRVVGAKGVKEWYPFTVR